MTTSQPVAEEVLADFVSAPPALPKEVRAAGRRSLLNMVGTTIGGSGETAIDRLVELSAEFGGADGSTLVGRRERADMLWAASINAAAANIFDFDDTHIPTVVHPSAPVGPAVLALAEARAALGRPVSGATLLEAFVLGVEITCRLGLAAGEAHYARGWHITSTAGIFGAALACGRLLELPPPALVDAIGNALAQAAGSVETLGTMSKSLGVGQAARGGLLAALLAERGYTGPRHPLTGARGFFSLYCDHADAASLTEGLGRSWEILNNTFKPYPCGVVLNPVIEACLALNAEGGFDARDIVEVELTGHPLLRQRTDRPGVTSGRLAQVCAQHAVAVSLLHGKADLDAFSDESVADPVLRAFAARLRFRDDPTYALESARVLLRFADGREIARTVDAAKGGLARPMSDAELAAKLAAQVEWRGLQLDVGRLVAAIESIEDAEDGAAFLALTRPQ
ncbi:MAG: MmgE/PrpD family protein [Mesorhizobium sp.]|nr:MmgE/PrpD family protein [Mesorhizobium sp.]MBL8575685.1 MmgE/PrpD family protein [Mesorhizobium sp.]